MAETNIPAIPKTKDEIPAIPKTKDEIIKAAIIAAQDPQSAGMVQALIEELKTGKPGIYTTEFGLALVMAAAGVYLAYRGKDELAAMVWSAAYGAYTMARAYLKKQSTPAVETPK